LCDAEFKSNGLVNLVKVVSIQHSIQAMTWLLLAASSQDYSENQEQKVEWKDFKCAIWPEKKWV
jgi:hypothetical protein